MSDVGDAHHGQRVQPAGDGELCGKLHPLQRTQHQVPLHLFAPVLRLLLLDGAIPRPSVASPPPLLLLQLASPHVRLGRRSRSQPRNRRSRPLRCSSSQRPRVDHCGSGRRGRRSRPIDGRRGHHQGGRRRTLFSADAHNNRRKADDVESVRRRRSRRLPHHATITK